MKNAFLYFLFVFFFVSCGSGKSCVVGEDKKNNCEVLNTFQLADSSRNLTFTHHCSKENLSLSNYWQSYALFEYQGSGYGKAAAVGNIDAGFIRGVQKIQGLRFSLEKLSIQSFPSWANHSLALALQLVNLENQQSSTGEFVTTYVENRQGAVSVKNYQISPSGELIWEQFIEPEFQTKGQKKMYKIPEKNPSILSPDIDSLEASHRLHLLIRNQDTGQTLILVGPVIENLKELFKLEAPEPQVLGFFDTINPFQKGGFWDFLGTAFRYKDCIYLRKQSKYELDKGF